MFLCSSESCRDGHHAASGMCFHWLLRDRNTHHMYNGCALSRTLSRWAICNLMCVPRYLHRFINGQEYSIICSISCHVCAFQNPVVMGGIQPQVRGFTRSLNGQEQSNNMTCLCAFQSPFMIGQPQVCLYLPSPLMDGDTR